ncbi:MAG: hypothetical protein AUJ52_04295 [Elusimicrobia bacterium CG1_02_63_36]|nr:MAG: hypothetical protein AUJ52_04295 [Elusimicrobia bacterium CG1_02_63_36]PJA15296.1 MAG: hypothetical protein COX66_10245 [Elusimicrobia bacterium CG_4_10_14_0_2_um_filter_63_34]PJB27020.1 MAG: hypothetical protein CO113_00955 [Elusimicrobia bacterium CG_4_9_14_3_um_filter_62_55]
MIEYVIAHNPDDRILAKACAVLSGGGLVCLPTDSNWVVVADPASKAGVEKLYRLKRAEPEKHFSVLCDSITKAAEIAWIDTSAYRILRQKIPGHFTFIFKAKKTITRYLRASKRDREIGIRFPPSPLAQKLIAAFASVLLSTNITHELLGLEDDSLEIYGFLIEDNASHLIELVLDPGETEFAGPSTIVSLIEGGEPELLRLGTGDW